MIVVRRMARPRAALFSFAVICTYLALAPRERDARAQPSAAPLTIAGKDLATRADEPARRPHEISVSYGASLGGYAAKAHGGMLRYSHALGDYAVGLVATASLGGEDLQATENLVTIFGLRARAERRFFSGTPLLAIGIGPVAEVIAQTLRRLDAASLAQPTYTAERDFRAVGGGGEAYASLRGSLGGTAFFGGELGFSLLFANTGSRLTPFPRGELSLFAGLVF